MGSSAGTELFRLGSRAAEQRRLWTGLVPYVTELHQRTGAVVAIVDTSAPDYWSVAYTAFGPAAAASGYGESWPHHPTDPRILSTALGRLALSDRPDLVENLLRSGVRPLTPYSRVSPRQLANDLRDASINSEVVEHHGVVLGWSCLAVPIPTGGQLTHPVLILTDRSTRFRLPVYLRAAHAAAETMGSHLRR